MADSSRSTPYFNDATGRWHYHDADEGGGSSSAVISSTDPGAIGAGGIWVRTDPGESYGPTIEIRNATDDGWVDDSNVGILTGLVYYNEDGTVGTAIYGYPTQANIDTPTGRLTVGANSVLSGGTAALLEAGNAVVSVEPAPGAGQINLKAGAGPAAFNVTNFDVNAVKRLLIGQDVDIPLDPDGGAIVIGTSNEVADASLSPGSCGFSYDDSNGAAKVKIKAKTADGTVVHGEIALT